MQNLAKIHIYGKENCSFCQRAKDLAKQLEIRLGVPDLLDYTDVQKWTKLQVAEKTGVEHFNTYPQIVITFTNSNNLYLGGFTDLEKWVKENLPTGRNIFEPRKRVKPYEYPELLSFKDSIRHAYWVHTEFNYEPDKQDFYVSVTDKEREVIKRSMLAISQVEVNVKRFWADLYKYLPKPEIDLVGVTFAESECRHFDAYANLLELLGMNDEFENILNVPALAERVDYMEKFQESKNLDNAGFVNSLSLFSLFVEHISLFGQFYCMMAFNKRKNMFKGLSNAIEATSKEEEIHGQFGLALYEIMRKDHPELFTEEFFARLQELADLAYKTEMKILDWIFEEGDLDFLTKAEVKNFIENRYNNSLQELGLPAKFEIDQELLAETKWFDLELLTTKEEDFFVKRSTAYSKNTNNFDDIF